MRISSALLAAACVLSGIVVIEAGPAAAQTYGGPVYAAPAEVTVYDEPVGYRPVPRYGYGTEPVATPVYDAPRRAPPPRYAPPVDPCRERGW